ncbi:MAG: protein kinase [Gemmatimonadales bacterium]|nr:protein kinase [Gemmatimonadales bacterium]
MNSPAPFGGAAEHAPPFDTRYRVERELGRGGMATVYLARDLRHDRPVALKVLHPELAAMLGPERFLREIQVTARLDHPAILPLLDSGADGGRVWYVMPYVEGGSLRDQVRHEVQLGVDEAVRIAREVAGAPHVSRRLRPTVRGENLHAPAVESPTRPHRGRPRPGRRRPTSLPGLPDLVRYAAPCAPPSGGGGPRGAGPALRSAPAIRAALADAQQCHRRSAKASVKMPSR